MKKLLGRCFFTLCILLLSGYSQLYAHAYRTPAHDSSSKLSEKIALATCVEGENSLPLVKKFAVSDREKTFIIGATEVREEEEDEHEPGFFKKSRESIHYFAAIFCTLTRGYFFSYMREILSFCKHFSDISSGRRHLTFQVFRI